MKEKFRLLLPVLFVFAILLTCLPLNPAWQTLSSRDSGVFMYNGWRLLNGEVPYLQLWDHKPPLVYFINAIGLLFGGVWGIWLIQCAVIGVSTYLLYQILLTKFPFKIVLPSVLLFLTILLRLIDGGNLTELYALPLQLSILYLLSVPSVKSKHSPIAIGVLLGLLFLAKQSAVGIAAIVIINLLFEFLTEKNWKNILWESVYVSIGVLLPILVTLLYFYMRHALPNFIDQVFTYNFVYRTFEQTSLKNALLGPFRFINVIFLGIGAVITAANFVPIKDFLNKKNRFAILILTLFVVEFGMTLIARRIPPHYYILMAPPTIYFYAQCFDAIANLLSKKIQYLVVTSLIIFSVLTFSGAVQRKFSDLKSQPDPILSRLISQTQVKSSVLMWGNEVSYNIYFHRTAGTKFSYQYPLYMPNYTTNALWQELCSDIEKNKPTLIIDTLNPKAPLSEAHICMLNIKNNNYLLEGKGENNWMVYRRRY